ncbi:molybdenum cofactor guanylyltransferase MobA [Mesorhizobium sp. L-8-3]|uniref:molybdenum cofactor guanylyltransferase MobA n=1 Tax=Mesorhizobium sp. L-8-3 TaxID=2744522 RepID=UPI001925646D|nr:molybdenum cofactor guanylyltransferase MobA [Mesorhizobium sp. L-8-3]BCH24636.1 molybdenum cofactor guanylyltransferase [Mesorhizobium sp. L-8-3]
MSTERIAGILLAGGKSSRMGGGDKSLRLLGRRSMLARAASRLAPQVAALALNANGDPARFAGFDLPVIADTLPGHPGPLAGILAGMEWAAATPNRTHLVSVACDTPFFPADLVSRLVEAADGRPERIAVAASGGRRHPVFGLWPLALRPALRYFMEEGATYRVSDFVERQDFALADFPMLTLVQGMVDPFFNVNTESDLMIAERIGAGLPI